VEAHAQSVRVVGCNNYSQHRRDDHADFSDDANAILVSKEVGHASGTEQIVDAGSAAAMPG